jgi:hypothetical protein
VGRSYERGGLLDLAGHDISGAAAVVRTIASILPATRARGVPVVYLQTGYKPDLSPDRRGSTRVKRIDDQLVAGAKLAPPAACSAW